MLNPLGSLRSVLSESQRAQREAVRQWLMLHLDLPEDTVISLNEITCLEPGCPPLETVIVILSLGEKTRQYKLHMALMDVQFTDLEQVFAPMQSNHSHQEKELGH